eukprot:5412679-Prymnesium_polylepis.1
MRQRGERCVILRPQRPETQIEPKEADADKERHDHARLLGISTDGENPPRQRQLAAHLERLPPEG